MSGPRRGSRAERARGLATLAEELAHDIDVELPAGLRLWGEAAAHAPTGRRAGRRPRPRMVDRRVAEGSDRAPWVLVAAMEATLPPVERERGAHYTPEQVAERVARAALPDAAGPVVDPACGAGALLLAAADRLAAAGCSRAEIAQDLLYGSDIDPLVVAVAEAAVALWSGGTVPAGGHLVVGDALLAGRALWPAAPSPGFAGVVGNPPFQGQLSRATARSPADAAVLRDRFGDAAVGAYVDTAALFLLAGVELAAPGGRVAMVQPQSTVASRDAGPVRVELARRARLVELWAPSERLFAARVHVCVPVLEVGEGDERTDWSTALAGARGTPSVDLVRRRRGAAVPERLADRARLLASFRDHYYGLAPHVVDAPATPPGPGGHPLVTAGLIDVGRCRWGERPVRFARRTWERPLVDVEAVRASSRRLDGWLGVVLAPKVVVASQTKVLEAAADLDGRWVPSTPTISVVPHDAAEVPRTLAAVCSPPASAWAATRAAGTALSADTIRVTRGMLEDLPLPSDPAAWAEAAEALLAGDLDTFASSATAMYRLDRASARDVLDWWRPRARSAWLPEGALR
ncbi:MAG: N-6 DNA methylase [Actinomycetota bacterium]